MYSFQLMKLIDASLTTVQIAYPSHEDSDDHLAAGLSRILEEYNRRVSPSRLLIVCPCGVEKNIKSCFDSLREHG